METENIPVKNEVNSELTNEPLLLDTNGNPLYTHKSNGQIALLPEVQKKTTTNNQSKEKKDSNKLEEIIQEVINHQNTLLKKVDVIQNSIKLIQRDIDTLKGGLQHLPAYDEENIEIIKDATEASKKEREQQPNDSNLREIQNIKRFFSILNSTRTKKSISLNNEILTQISDLLSKYLEGKELGTSEIINTGLMLALIKNKL